MKVLQQTTYRGFDLEIIDREPFPGIGWRLPYYTITGKGMHLESPGAFYDGAPDHPEGAIEWALSAAKTTIDKLLGSTA